MKQIEYLVVGLGIAGVSFCEQLRKHNKSFVVFNGGEQASTAVSGGVFNPVVLKRFTAAWEAKAHLEYAIPFYHELARLLQIQVIHTLPVYRILKNTEEQNNWSVASDKRELSSFLSSELETNTNPEINAPYGFGKVIVSGRIYPSQLLQKYAEYLAMHRQYHAEAFDYQELNISEASIRYKEYSAKRIIFAEGAAARFNPFFPKDLIRPNKGEYLVIKAPNLQLSNLLKGGMFVIPLGDDLYKVGATYDREDTTLEPTDSARQEILHKLKDMIRCAFEIVDQIAGLRPTIPDRRPLLGTHQQYEQIAFFNGLGTRGILMAPKLASYLFDHLEHGETLPKEVRLDRFS